MATTINIKWSSLEILFDGQDVTRVLLLNSHGDQTFPIPTGCWKQEREWSVVKGPVIVVTRILKNNRFKLR